MPLGLKKLSLGQEQGNGAPSEDITNVAPPHPPKEAPPTYAITDPAGESADPIPAELSAAFSNLKLPDKPPALPTADYCLAHLKLLNSFHALKEDIGYTDGLFGLQDARCEVLEGK